MTNSEILKYSFYNENNICVIKRKNIYIPEEFLAKPYIDIPEVIYNDYSP